MKWRQTSTWRIISPTLQSVVARGEWGSDSEAAYQHLQFESRYQAEVQVDSDLSGPQASRSISQTLSKGDTEVQVATRSLSTRGVCLYAAPYIFTYSLAHLFRGR